MNEIEMAIDAIGIALAQEPPAAIEQGYGFYLVIEDALATALIALREKLERDKGCEYCQSENGQGTDIWHGNQLSVGYGVYRAIKFCPMCGKSLEGVTNER